jgi:hypothetical protein
MTTKCRHRWVRHTPTGVPCTLEYHAPIPCHVRFHRRALARPGFDESLATREVDHATSAWADLSDRQSSKPGNTGNPFASAAMSTTNTVANVSTRRYRSAREALRTAASDARFFLAALLRLESNFERHGGRCLGLVIGPSDSGVPNASDGPDVPIAAWYHTL